MQSLIDSFISKFITEELGKDINEDADLFSWRLKWFKEKCDADRKKCKLIYNTLKNMIELKNMSSNILEIIAVYATGKIKICSLCNKNKILCLETEKYKDEFKETISDKHHDVYCKQCINNAQIKECYHCGKYFLKWKFVSVESDCVCWDCISTGECAQFYECACDITGVNRDFGCNDDKNVLHNYIKLLNAIFDQ